MSEQHTPLPNEFHTWLAERGQDAYALVWVAEGSEPTGWAETEAPRVGETGIARPGADLTRIAPQEVTHGQQETLRRWLQLDDGVRHLAILTAGLGGLREHTPGELAAQLMHDPAGGEARLTDQLAGWLYRRGAQAQQDRKPRWTAAAAAWTCHMRALASYPPPSVLRASLERAGEQDQTTADLVVSKGEKTADLLDRLERVYRTRTELIEDWNTVESLSADVPALTELADWLLDQIALRDASAQQLRAVLEPDITDYLRDRRTDDSPLNATVPALDAQRAAHLDQARETVRAYTADAHSGREEEAQQLLDSFPIPARALATSGPAVAWRQHSATAQDAVNDLAAQLAATTGDPADYFAGPDLLHAQIRYLAARESQLHLIHDALGRLAFPTPAPRNLPEELTPVAAAQTQRRVIEAFGTLERATQTLDGQIHYQLQHPVPTHRHATTSAETGLLTRARNALERIAPPAVTFNEEEVRARVRAMSRPVTLDRTGPVAPPAHDDAHAQAHAQALAAGSATPGVNR
ncbi:hypothetical protein [Streptomyces botrytidirepellens]|uniref:Uncharacterized protein n=1 Tax=Streptomyces botrytidirepellens TaxID=2486417 RepID=A0A3M8SNM8_9ACTN|nr:hypothetical protein [Streptomyces botrytidirepellens]RNF81146.1 hypothetical protein EEJ42_47025 [Streptomyces botrytidirepellens]